MQIKEITVEQKKQVKQYEPVTLSITATLDEDDDLDKTVEDLKFYLDYKLNQDVRDTKAAEIQSEIDNNQDAKGKELNEVAVKARQDWLNQYGEAYDKFTALDFIHGNE